MGNETVTLEAPGSYRVLVGEVKPVQGILTISVSMLSLPRTQGAAWEQAERWATMSKRSQKMESINHSLVLWTELGDTASIARTYLKRESVFRHSDLRAAVAEDDRALELCRTISDIRCTAEAINNSGWLCSQLGEVDQARERLEEAAQDWGRLHDPLNAGKTRSNLGALLWQSGDFQDALRNLDIAGDIFRQVDTVAYARVLNIRGLLYQSLAEYEKAQVYFESAVTGFTRGKSPNDLVRARLNLGRNYMLAGHLLQARSLLRHILVDARQLPDNQTVADVLRNLGQTHLKLGNVDQAREQFEEALQIDRSIGNVRGQSSALHSLGLVAQRKGDPPSARSFLRQAIKLRRESGLRDDASESLYSLAELEYGTGNPKAAREDSEQALNLLESIRSQVPSPALRASFYSRKRRFFDLLVDMAMARADEKSNVDGLLAAERGRARALMDMLAGGSLLQQLPEDLVNRRTHIQQRISYMAILLSSAPPVSAERQADLRQQIERLVAEDEDLEAQIRQMVGQKIGQPLTSIEGIQHNALPSNSALMEFHLGTRKSYLWLVDAQQVRAYSLPPATTIEAQAAPVVKQFGRILERRRSPAKQAEFKQAMKKLSATLLGQLAGIPLPELLILVPDGVLHRIPFAALESPEASTPLGLVHDLVQIPSAAYLTFGRKPRSVTQFPQTVLAMVDPVYSSTDPRVPNGHQGGSLIRSEIPLDRLPFTFEVKTIESLVAANRRKIFRGFEASRATLSKLHLRDFGLLHISTHALIDDRTPELSRLVLSMVDHRGRPVDGALEPYQLAQFHLDDSTIVLSACDTALGKQVLGEGLAGMTSSLLYAGGAQLVLTLTEIDAEASSRFLSGVYQRFLPGSVSMEHSLRLTRQAMAQDRQFSDPYYWASFIVVGRPAGPVGGAENGF